MKKAILAAVILATAFAACKKNNTTPASNSNGSTPGFTWTENGGSTITADSAYWTTYSGGTGIRAYKGGMASFFEINFANASVGSQALGSGLTMLKGSNTVINSTSGTVSIASNTSDKLTGTITASVNGGGLSTISCTYTSLPKR